MMIHDTIGPVSQDHPPPLEKKLLQRIFRTYGEVELSNNEELLNAMIETASIGLGTVSSSSKEETEKPRVVMDTPTFIRALTNDVLLLDPDSELERTTNEHDVFRTNHSKGGRLNAMYADQLFDTISRRTGNASSITEDIECDEGGPIKNHYKDSRPILRLFTAPAIDFFADTYRSKLLTCVLWLGYLMSYLSQTYFSKEWFGAGSCSENDYYCQILSSMRSWFFKGLTVGLIGMAYVGFGGLGNNMYARSIMPAVAAIATIGAFDTVYYLRGPAANLDQSESPVEYWVYLVAHYVCLGLGGIVILLQFANLVRLALLSCSKKKERLSWFFRHPAVDAEARTKQAAAYKMNRLVQNAYRVHQSFEKGQESEKLHGRALLNFGKSFINRGTKVEVVGVSWSWRELFSGRILAQEGVWLSSRVIAGNAYQIAAIAILVTLLASWVINETKANNVQPQCTESACLGYACYSTCENWANTQNWSFDSNGNYYQAYMTACVALNCVCEGCGRTPSISNNIIYIATSIGAFSALATTLIIAFLYIPSYIVTTLKLRSGAIPSLRDNNFPDFRQAADNVTLLLGSVFWGLMATGAFFFFLIVIPVLLIAHPATRPRALLVLSHIAGVFISVLLKILLLCAVRRKYLGGFYRKYPAVTNVIGLFVECWNIYLAAAHIIKRVVRLFLASVFYIGRIDTPLLSVSGIGVTTLDALPQIFRQDILVHEAHRHPYIDLLSKIFMYKLRYEERFVHTAGSGWRLLFTLSLMPWMRKYRIQHRPAPSQEVDDDDDDSQEGNERKDILMGMSNTNFKKITTLKRENAKINEAKTELQRELESCKNSYEEEIAALKKWIKYLEENVCVV